VVELIKIYRRSRPARRRAPKCVLPFLIEEWGIRPVASRTCHARLDMSSLFRGGICALQTRADHLGVSSQKQVRFVALGLCIPTGRVNRISWTSSHVCRRLWQRRDSSHDRTEPSFPNVPVEHRGRLLEDLYSSTSRLALLPLWRIGRLCPARIIAILLSSKRRAVRSRSPGPS